jgi:hypothetical protein
MYEGRAMVFKSVESAHIYLAKMSIIGTGFDQYKVISKDEYEILKVMEL